MSRFWITTSLAVPAFLAIGYFMHGWQRWSAFAVFWAVFATIIGLGVTYIRLQFFAPAICRIETSKRLIALTFDDGPDEFSTPPLLGLLQREAVTGTFFCIGKNVEAHPAIAARIVADGHLIANHTQNHRKLTSLSFASALQQEIETAQHSIESATGQAPSYFRPPVGMTNPHFASALRKTDMTLVGWDVRSLDTLLSAEDAVARIVRQARPGSIVLLHDGGLPVEKVLAIATATIRILRERGFTFVRLDALIAAADSRPRRSAGDLADADRGRDECRDPVGDPIRSME